MAVFNPENLSLLGRNIKREDKIYRSNNTTLSDFKSRSESQHLMQRIQSQKNKIASRYLGKKLLIFSLFIYPIRPRNLLALHLSRSRAATRSVLFFPFYRARVLKRVCISRFSSLLPCARMRWTKRPPFPPITPPSSAFLPFAQNLLWLRGSKSSEVPSTIIFG